MGALCWRSSEGSLGLAQDKWAMFEEKMKAEGLSQAAIGAFKHNYDQLVKGVTGLVGSTDSARSALLRGTH